MVCREQKKYEDALKLHQRSLELYEELKDNWGIANALNNIGVVWYRFLYSRKIIDEPLEAAQTLTKFWKYTIKHWKSGGRLATQLG
jgi:hypothetical protein